jgi:uncharacterized protein involved in exopolysaccharide biosynthesis
MIEENVDKSRRAVLVFVDEIPNGGHSEPLIGVLLSYWRSISTCVLVAAVLAIAYGVAAPKWYRAQTLIAPVPMDPSTSALGALDGEIGGLASLVGLDIGGGEDQEKEALARLTSREFIYGYIESKNLLPIFFAGKWDADAKAWKNPAKPPSIEDGYQYFVGRIFTVSEDRKTELIKVAVDWKNPELAREWANELVVRINADRREVARAESERNLQFLNRELEKASIIDLRQAINRLVETEIRKRMLVNVREEYAFKVIDPAYLPGNRAVVRPRIAMLTAVAAALGGLLGCGLALFRHFRRRN